MLSVESPFFLRQWMFLVLNRTMSLFLTRDYPYANSLSWDLVSPGMIVEIGRALHASDQISIQQGHQVQPAEAFSNLLHLDPTLCRRIPASA